MDATPTHDVTPMTVEELAQRLGRAEPLVLLDVRENSERALCAIPAEGLHIPMREVPAQVDAIRATAAQAPLVVYCHHGVRSMAVAAWLAGQGINGVSNLDGGIDAWSLRVDPDVTRY